MTIVTLLTDFGTADSYVAEMKAVLLSRVPSATIVDISHDVPPGDVRCAQYLLSRAWHRFPDGTIHLAVVDPAVGTERRAIAAEAANHRFVAPDNGVLSFLPRDARFVALPVPRAAAPTFHGRDVFAPAMAALASGNRLDQLGEAIKQPQRSPLPTARSQGDGVIGEVHRPRGGKQPLRPKLDFVSREMHGAVGHRLVLRPPIETGFTPGALPGSRAIHYEPDGYRFSPCPAAVPAWSRFPRTNSPPRAVAECTTGTRAAAGRSPIQSPFPTLDSGLHPTDFRRGRPLAAAWRASGRRFRHSARHRATTCRCSCGAGDRLPRCWRS